MRGIDTAGIHVPRRRLPASEIEASWGTAPSGVESKAVPGADEDAITMAIAAAENALSRTDTDRDNLAFLGLATTTPPLEEELLTGRLVRALGLPAGITTRAATQSTLGGGRVLADALDAEGPALAVAADAPRGDPDGADAVGAGAAAFLVVDDAVVPITDVASHTDDAPGIRFRQRGDDRVEGLGITNYDRSVVGEHVGTVVDRLAVASDEVAGAAIHQPDGKLPYRVAGEFDGEAIARGTVVDRVGDTGAAGVPLGLVVALSAATDGEQTVGAFFGSGGGAIALACEGGLDRSMDELDGGVEIDYPHYLRERGYIADGEVAGGGANVSLPSWQRELDQRYRLVAGRCPDCGELVFPPEGACPNCQSLVEYEPVELPREGEVVARTVIEQGAAPPEFAPQQAREGAFAVAIIECGGATLPAQVVDCDPDAVAVGDLVRATIRRIYQQEGVPRYGVKFVPND